MTTMEGLIKHGYVFGEHLGIGGFGRVYKATKEGKIFMIRKVFPNEIFNFGEIEENFVKNFRTLCPFLVRCLETFHDVDDIGHLFIFIVMEYWAHDNLYTLVKSPLNAIKVMKVFIQGGLALHTLHMNNIIHRNIKPENFLLDDNDNLKIYDFGCAYILSKNSEKMTKYMGSIHYISPQIGLGQTYGFKTDVWSFGVLMYELCTGNRPFVAPSQYALIKAITKNTIEPIIPSAHCPADLAQMIHVMLEKSEENRPSIATLLSNPFVVNNARHPDVDLYQFYPSDLKSDIEMREKDAIVPFQINKSKKSDGGEGQNKKEMDG